MKSHSEHTGDTINKLTEAVQRAEQRSKISTQFLSYMPSAEAWQATGLNYEPGLPIGVGATEEAAIADLKEKEAERKAGLCSVCERPASEPLTSEFLPGYIYCSETCRDQAEMEALSGMLKLLG